MEIDNLFLLLRVGLEIDSPSEISLESLRKMTQKDWQGLRFMADKQGVSAIVFDGLRILVDTFGKDKIAPDVPLGDWQMYVYDWIGLMTQVEYQNEQQLHVMNLLARKWIEGGCQVMVFKGQANALNYPKPKHRAVGDIDCYLFGNYERGNDIARDNGAEVDESWYKHSQIFYKDEMFENHQYLVATRLGGRSKSLNRDLINELNGIILKNFPGSQVLLPPVQWTAMFLSYHGCGHFISEGLRLKQLLDWAMFLQKYQNDIDWPAFYAFCERHHLRRFTEAATALSVEYLGVKITNPDISTVSPYAERILQSALYDDDYVFSSGEGSWHNRWHLVRNLFHYRWKYENIYELSPWRQLWYYTCGYLFHTE